jgi:protein gp37
MAKRFEALRPKHGEVEYVPESHVRFGAGRRRVIAIWNDLFHEGVTDSAIEATLAAMTATNNLYIVLTKRPWRASQYTHGKGRRLPDNVLFGATLTETGTKYCEDVLSYAVSVPRFCLSCEPLLEGRPTYLEATFGRMRRADIQKYLRWVIVGRERGPGARPMDKESLSRIRTFCALHEVPIWEKVTDGQERRMDPRLEYTELLP